MTEYSTAVGYPAPSPAAPRPVRDAARDLRAGAVVVAVLAVVGIVAGVIWATWSPPQPMGFRQSNGPAWSIEESESAIAADGRFAVLALVTGLLAALALWRRTRLRGPIAVVALGAGCLVGAQSTRLVGYLFGGGATGGQACVLYLPDPVRGSCIRHMKLSVHVPALYVLAAAVAVFVYALCAAFAVRDDLGRRDPVRLMMLRRRASVGRGRESQDARRDGDGAGQPQQ